MSPSTMFSTHQHKKNGLFAAKTTRDVHEVWSWNFNTEMDAFVRAASRSGANAVIAFDTEFPGFLVKETRFADEATQHKILRENVTLLHPIQIGFAVADTDGTLHGVWNFNLLFNFEFDFYMESSMHFLQAAGIDFHRHATQGIPLQKLGRRLLHSSPLFATQHCRLPTWITFSGQYDMGYLFNIVSEQPLPESLDRYREALASLCPKCFELRTRVPIGSLEDLVRMHGLERLGTAHTAGSDALATLDLYFRVRGEEDLSPKVVPEHVEQDKETIAKRLADAMEHPDETTSHASPKKSWGAAARSAMLGALSGASAL